MSTNNIKEKYKTKLEKLSIEQDYQNKRNKLTFGTYTKKLVAIIVFVCLVDIQLSYVLALMGKDPLENLSGAIVTTVLGTAIVYMIKAWFDSWAEHKNNDTKINEILAELNDHIDNDMPENNILEEDSEEILSEDDSYGN